jgi:heme/copper-type cytochrome/quinol oxidase subunit 4
VRYGLTCAAIVGTLVLLAALLLDPAGLAGVLIAAAVALPVQIVLFVAMSKSPAGTNRFLAAWIGGMLVRMVVVGSVALALSLRPGSAEAPTLLGLVGFFFVMVLLEPAFLGLRSARGASELRRE